MEILATFFNIYLNIMHFNLQNVYFLSFISTFSLPSVDMHQCCKSNDLSFFYSITDIFTFYFITWCFPEQVIFHRYMLHSWNMNCHFSRLLHIDSKINPRLHKQMDIVQEFSVSYSYLGNHEELFKEIILH